MRKRDAYFPPGASYRADCIVLTSRRLILPGDTRNGALAGLASSLRRWVFEEDEEYSKAGLKTMIIPFKVTLVAGAGYAVPPEGRVMPEDCLFRDELHGQALELRRLEVGVIGQDKNYVIFPVPAKKDCHS